MTKHIQIDITCKIHKLAQDINKKNIIPNNLEVKKLLQLKPYIQRTNENSTPTSSNNDYNTQPESIIQNTSNINKAQHKPTQQKTELTYTNSKTISQSRTKNSK